MESQKPVKNNKSSVSLDLRLLCMVLAAVIIVMLLLWKPWEARISADSRTVKVTGETTLKAEPDEYVFYPNYQFKAADKATALDQANKKNEELVAKLKGLGVDSSKIKTNTNGYEDTKYLPSGQPTEDPSYVYTLVVTVTVGNKDLAQKIQDYLDTTSPIGSVSPQATFSSAKRKQLESQARDAATEDARTKAEQNAKNLGFKVGAVKEVSDGQGFDVMPLTSGRGEIALDSRMAVSASPSLQPGENEINYSVTVTYFVK